MAFVAPWLNPPNFIGAASAGASAGLGARAQDVREEQIQDRLKMAYDALQQREENQAAVLKSKYDLAENTMALRRDALAQQQQYHSALMDQRERRMQDLSDYRSALLEGRNRNIHFGAQGEVLKYDPESEQVKVVRPAHEKPGREATISIPLDKNNPFGPKISGPMSDPEIARRFAELSAAPPPKPAATGFSLTDPSTWFGKGATSSSPVVPTQAVPSAAPTPSGPPTITTKKEYDDLPSGAIYIGTNGKPHRKP